MNFWKRFCLTLIFIALGPLFLAEGNEPLTLSDCYRLTLRQSEKVALQKELIEEPRRAFRWPLR